VDVSKFFHREYVVRAGDELTREGLVGFRLEHPPRRSEIEFGM